MKNITNDFVKLFLINCAIEIIKKKSTSSGRSLLFILEKLNFKKILKNNPDYVLTYQYNNLTLCSKSWKKVENFLNKIVEDKSIDIITEIEKITIDNKILLSIENLSLIINYSFELFLSLTKDIIPYYDSIVQSLNDLNLKFDKFDVIDKTTTSINIQKILGSPNIKKELLNSSLINELMTILKGKSNYFDSEQKNFFNELNEEYFKIKENINSFNINLETTNYLIISQSLEKIIDSKEKELPLLQTIFDETEKVCQLSSNMGLKFQFKNFESFVSIELYLAILKENTRNKSNHNTISTMKNDLLNKFIKCNNEKLFTTLLYKCLLSEYITEMFDLIQYYQLNKNNNTYDIFFTGIDFQNKNILIEEIYKKYQKNNEILTKLNSPDSTGNENKNILIKIKTQKNQDIIDGLSYYLSNNDFINSYDHCLK